MFSLTLSVVLCVTVNFEFCEVLVTIGVVLGTHCRAFFVFITALPSGNEPRYMIDSAYGVVLDVGRYMRWERSCRSYFDVSKRKGYRIEQLPSSFVPEVIRIWQTMDNRDLERYAALSPGMVTCLQDLEKELQAIDKAPIGYCIKGCLQKCLVEHADAAGRVYTPLVEQFYLQFPRGIQLVRVSRRPTLLNCLDQHQQFVLPEGDFQQRKQEEICLQRWLAKRIALDRRRMPLAMAGERPVVRMPQEDLSQLRMGDQLCGGPRMPILNEDWPSFEKPAAESDDNKFNNSDAQSR